jgi:hypothetical protein
MSINFKLQKKQQDKKMSIVQALSASPFGYDCLGKKIIPTRMLSSLVVTLSSSHLAEK